MTAAELERLMIEKFGPDFRDKVIRGPLGTFRLADAFEECGLEDPRRSRSSSGACGLWQFTPSGQILSEDNSKEA